MCRSVGADKFDNLGDGTNQTESTEEKGEREREKIVIRDFGGGLSWQEGGEGCQESTNPRPPPTHKLPALLKSKGKASWVSIYVRDLTKKGGGGNNNNNRRKKEQATMYI